MLNYLKAECYKVARRKYTYIFLLLILLGEGLVLFSTWFVNAHGAGNSFSTVVSILTLMLMIGMFLVIVVCDIVFSDQYKHNTLKNEVSFGIPRARIYMGKALASLLVALVMMAVLVLFFLGGAYLLMPMDEYADVALVELGLVLAGILPLWIGALSVTMMLFLLVRSNVMAAFAAVGVIGLLPSALQMMSVLTGSSVFARLRGFCLMAPLDSMYELASVPGMRWAWILGMSWTVISTVVGLILFQRREIN